MIKRLFADTEHNKNCTKLLNTMYLADMNSIFKKMILENMSHFKQLTTYAILFLLITWLWQLEEHFFLNHDDDFFVKGMYTAISSRARNTTMTNNIWMMLNPSVGIDS